jgi:Concanavalin A-like lectin/glucanases superfamily
MYDARSALTQFNVLPSRPADNTDGMAAWWTFNDGTATDFSGNQNNGTLTNGPALVGGISGNALSFNGSNQYISVPIGTSSPLKFQGNFSVSAWVKPTSLHNYGNVIGTGNVNTSYGLITFADGEWHWQLSSGADVQAPAGSLVNGTWAHIAATYDGTTVSLYQNGAFVTSGARGQPGVPTSPFYIGADVGNGRYFSGIIDDVRAYVRTLSPAEINAIYNQSIAYQQGYPEMEMPALMTSASITGTLSVTEANDTLSSTSTSTIVGTLSTTEANDTLSSTVNVSVVGTLSVTEANDTLSSTTNVSVVGTLSVTEDNDTLSSTATIGSSVAGSLAVTEANDTLSSSVNVSVVGTLAVTEANDVLNSTVNVSVVGTLSVTEDNDVLSSNATIGSSVSGSLSVTEANDTISSTVNVSVVGTLAVTEANDTLSSTTNVSITSTLAVTEANDTLSSTGFSGTIGCSLSITESNDVLASTCTTVTGVVTGGRQREAIEWGWDWYNAPNPFTVSNIRTSAARLGQLGGIASGKARNR